MRILVVNPIIYTSETKNIKRVKSIKDTMIYDLCLAFNKMGHEVCLFAAEPFKPNIEEEYPFKIIWGKCVFKNIFMPHCLPFMPDLFKYIKNNKNNYDLIICSEVFSISSLISVILSNKNTIIWHELAKHNKIFAKVPSKIWYGIIARIFMRNTRVVPRSVEAKEFISHYCKNTDSRIIDHGVNLDKFKISNQKQKKFIVCSQLIPRKKIDGIIRSFKKYIEKYDNEYVLYIIGEGEQREELEKLTASLGLNSNVIFTGKLSHSMLLPHLSESKALLVNTEKDNNMISIIESIAVGTPVVTTPIPLNATYIRESKLGIVAFWNEEQLNDVVTNNEWYVSNCLQYREKLSSEDKVRMFIEYVK